MRSKLFKITLAIFALVFLLLSCADSSPLTFSGSEVASSSSTASSNSFDAPSSSSAEPSSSSETPSSSSSNPCDGFTNETRNHYGKDKPQFCDERDGKKYVYMETDTQIWMAENLNVPHRTGYGDSYCYGNDASEKEINCAKYGRLYDWAAAMDLPSICNGVSCANQIKSPHRGLCPAGFHVPTNDDWDKLLRYVDEANNGFGSGTPYDSETAGKYLKTASGWNAYDGVSGNGTDNYGFSALPGGVYNGNFVNAGTHGYWLSASEGENSGNNAYRRIMSYSYMGIQMYDVGKSFGYSLRCVKNND